MKESMKDLDLELTDALRREEPSAGFADRVLSRVAAQRTAEHSRPASFGPGIIGGSDRLRASGASASLAEAREQVGRAETEGPARQSRSHLSFLHWAAAAALVAAVAGGVDYVAKQKDRAEGEAAKDRVVQALHIAGAKLQLVQTKITQLHEQPEKN
jgi:hypothetical protein